MSKILKNVANLMEVVLADIKRHVINIFQCLLDGYETGTVNYELRKRDIDKFKEF